MGLHQHSDKDIWGDGLVQPLQTSKAPEMGRNLPGGEQRQRLGSGREALSALPPAAGGHHMSKRKRACERSDDRSIVMSNFLYDALRHLLWINIVLVEMSVLEAFKQVSGCT